MKNHYRHLVSSLLLLVALAASCHHTGPALSEPIARLSAVQTAGTSPLTVNFDASGSTDPDGHIVNYQWDFQSDGVIDDTTTIPTTSHTYTGVSDNVAELTVVDNSGNSDSTTLLIRVLAGTWHTQTLDTVGNVGAFSSAAIVDNRPAIAYGDLTNHRQKFVIAANDAGTAWGIPLTVDLNQRGGEFCDLAEINGRPAISFVDDAAGQAMYIRSFDQTGQTWDTPVAVGIPGTIGDTALIQLGGRPALAFVDESNGTDGDPVFLSANDASGTSWGGGILVDDTGEDVAALDMQVVNGAPAIGYVEELGRDLRFVQARDPGGSSWFLPTSAVSAGAVGNMLSLAVVNGRPMMSYLDTSGANTDLAAVRSNDPDGIAWQAPVAVDASGDSSGQYSSLAVVGGRPAIAYYDLSAGSLMYVQANDNDGAAWGVPITVDDGAAVGQYCSLVNVGGAPGIAYYDGDSQDLVWSVLE